jgi:hypothetical protein
VLLGAGALATAVALYSVLYRSNDRVLYPVSYPSTL